MNPLVLHARDRVGRLTLSATCTFLFAAVLYPIWRSFEVWFGKEEIDPTLVLATSRIGFFWRMASVSYAGFFVFLGAYVLAKHYPTSMLKGLRAGVPLALLVIVVQGLVAP